MTPNLIRLSRLWVAAPVLLHLCACGRTPQSSPPAVESRYFAKISIDPQAKHLLLTDCGRSAEVFDGCDLLSLDLTNGRLARYVVGEARILEGSYSARGDEIMLIVTPAGRGLTLDDASEQSQIAMMRPDGSGWRVLNVPAGVKSGPTLAPDEKHVAYWRGVPRPAGAKTFAADHDVFEFDMDTGGEALFAGPFSFFDKASITYLTPDRLLVGAYAARKNVETLSEYDRVNNRSAVYVVERGTTELSRPVLRDVTGANWPAKDAADNTYFTGERAGISFFRRSPGGQITQWTAPAESVGNGIRDVAVASNGAAMAYLFDPSTDPFHVDRSKSPLVGLFDTKAGQWRTVDVPPTARATSITVKP